MKRTYTTYIQIDSVRLNTSPLKISAEAKRSINVLFHAYPIHNTIARMELTRTELVTDSPFLVDNITSPFFDKKREEFKASVTSLIRDKLNIYLKPEEVLEVMENIALDISTVFELKEPGKSVKDTKE